MNLETEIMNRIRLAMGKLANVRLWRNSVGFDARAKVNYGICNPGGADLIGFTEREGKAIFTAIEVKRPGGVRSPEQENFIRIVREAGGLAGFAQSVEEAENIVRGPHGNNQ